MYIKIVKIKGGGTRGALGALAPTKFVSAHRNLVFYNRNMSC